MLVCTALVGCTSEDSPEVNNEVKQGSEYYMAVNFSMAGSASSRAFQDYPYENGNDEIKVTSAVFHFLNAAGEACADPCTVTTGLTWNDMNGTNSVEKKSGKVIVMRNPTSIPASIIAILNPTDAMKAKSNYSTLTGMSGDYATTALTTSGAFIMSNSVYMNSNKEAVIGTPVTNENLYVTTVGQNGTEPTDKEILNAIKPVTIPVEKVVAKVNVTEKKDNEDKSAVTVSGTGVKLNGAETATNLDVVITGWWLDRTNPQSYLLKKIDTSWAGAWWNHVDYKRSYWATAYTPTAYTHYAYSTATTDDKYCLENTNQTYHTQVVVAAKLQQNGKEVSLIKWRSNFYTEDGFKDEFINLAEVQQYYKESTEAGKYETIDADDLDFTYNKTSNTSDEGLKDYQAQVVLKTGVTVYKKVNGTINTTAEKEADVNAVLSGLATVQFWQDGQTYYYTSIKHSDVTEDTGKMAEFGVVRNHLYKLTINSITGLGTPVPNKDLVIVPGDVTDATEYSYIAADVEVLQYKVVSQSVDLGK